MARVVKRPVYGSLPSCARVHKFPTVCVSDRDDVRSESSSNSTTECSPRRKDDFLRYEDTSDEDEFSGSVFNKISNNFVDLISQRSFGFDRLSPSAVDSEYSTRHLLTNNILRERTIKLGQMNKIFCSQWLNDHQIVFGSKCNKLMVYDTCRRDTFSLPLLKSFKTSKPPNFQCGIHSLAINPSRTILATGAENTKDIAFYKLPTFDPLAVGEDAHDDWMFDVVWLDDYFLVSGSRDTTMALWKLDESVEGDYLHGIAQLRPLAVKPCKTAEKVRALAFNKKEMEIAALSLNGYIHIWKADTFKQVISHKLLQGMETVCLSYHEDHAIYAIGSRSHTTILDSRTIQPIQNKTILSLYPTYGIRSVSFRGDILTIGTGTGAILFYDLRAAKYLNSNRHDGEVVFKTNTGWVGTDEASQDLSRYAPAIYTHCYDESGTRFFAAGGPLAVERQGNYASLWS